jgi:hypothetical protein
MAILRKQTVELRLPRLLHWLLVERWLFSRRAEVRR